MNLWHKGISPLTSFIPHFKLPPISPLFYAFFTVYFQLWIRWNCVTKTIRHISLFMHLESFSCLVQWNKWFFYISFYRSDYLQFVGACLLSSCEEAGVLLCIFGSRFDGPSSQMFLMAPHFQLSSISDVLHQSLHPTIFNVCLHILPDSKSYP